MSIRIVKSDRRVRVTWDLICRLLVLWVLTAGSSPLLAQGCAMCKTALEGQTDSIVNALKMGIVVMLLPAIAIVTAIILALRESSARDRTAGEPGLSGSRIRPEAG